MGRSSVSLKVRRDVSGLWMCRIYACMPAEALKAGASAAVCSDHFARGGAGSVDLAEAVMHACAENRADQAKGLGGFKLLYPDSLSIKEKINTVVREIYGGDGAEFSDKASKQIAQYESAGFGNLPVCMAKTQYSLSADPKAKGVPTGFTVPVREIRASVGAGFLYPICGDMMTVPGLPTRPGFYDIDYDIEHDRCIGLF